jgi:hypothetical protein
MIKYLKHLTVFLDNFSALFNVLGFEKRFKISGLQDGAWNGTSCLYFSKLPEPPKLLTMMLHLMPLNLRI